MFYDQDSDDLLDGLWRQAQDFIAWRQELTEWAGGEAKMQLWVECLAWEEG